MNQNVQLVPVCILLPLALEELKKQQSLGWNDFLRKAAAASPNLQRPLLNIEVVIKENQLNNCVSN
jgi:hypothetical protein